MEKIRIFRSWKSDCWKGDFATALEVYTRDELKQISDFGYNGIWLNEKLMDYTPSKIFPEFGKKKEEYLDILKRLIDRAGQSGIKVYLYCLEPRALNATDPFWLNHPELKGQSHPTCYDPNTKQPGMFYSLCSSKEKVQEYLFDSFYHIGQELQGLGGYFAITAGEHHSTCYGTCWNEHFNLHFPGVDGGEEKYKEVFDCPYCAKRSIAETISEVLNTVHKGLTTENKDASLIAWDWGWTRMIQPNPEIDIINLLHKDIIVQCDFEIGGSKNILGKERNIFEYSLSYSGPTERFKKIHSFLKSTGRKMSAKFQVGTTHEIATIPNLPLIHNLTEKMRFAHDNLDVAFFTWNFGNMPTLNTFLAGKLFSHEGEITQTVVDEYISSYLKVSANELEVLHEVWGTFSKAFDSYPYTVPFLYLGFINYAPALWLKPQKTKGTDTFASCFAIPIEERGDDWRRSFGCYTLEEFIEGFTTVARVWQEGLDILKKLDMENISEELQKELNSAECVIYILKSTINIFKLFDICENWHGNEQEKADYKKIALAEKENCKQLLPLLRKDSRLGFHAECQAYLFNEQMVIDKIKKIDSFI